MPVEIHGKQYRTVAERVTDFWSDRTASEWSIITEKMSEDAGLITFKATIMHLERIVATGHSDEVRGANMINKTSALENAETSAVGRALAFIGLGGEEIRSADELAQAIHKQQSMNGTDIDIPRLRDIVVEAIRMVDEDSPDMDAEARSAREMYEPLSNDERQWVNGQLRLKKTTNPETGRDIQYWSLFKQYLLHAAEVNTDA